MIIDRVNSRIFSRLGQRGSIFGMAALELAKEDDKLILMTADLAQLSGMDRFIKTYPNQYINVGIAEQNMVGMAAGLCAEGFHPVVTTYATFLTMRSCEQMRHFMGYMHLPIVAVGSGAGLSQGFAGNTHYTIEDISMMRAIPGLTIYSPADAGSAVKLLEKTIKSNEPTYIRLTGNLNCPIVYKEDVDFETCSSIECKKAKGNAEITIMAVGTMVSSAIKASDILEEKGLSVNVIDMFSIKPIDSDAIYKACKSKLIVSIEEHNKIGGLGAAVAEIMSDIDHSSRLLRLGVNDCFDAACDYEGLLEQNRLTPELIAEDILIKFNSL